MTNVDLPTVSIAKGGTGQTTANAGFNALAPSQTGNSGKVLTTNGTNTSWGLAAATWGSITGTLSSQSDLQSALNGKQATITGAATTIVSSNLTPNYALESNGSGKVAISSVTSTELGYLSGVTSGIQSQINSASSAGGLGYSQTWVDCKSSHPTTSLPAAPNVIYQNTTGKPIMVFVSYSLSSLANNYMKVGSAYPPSTILSHTFAGGTIYNVSFIVPNNWYYEWSSAGGTVDYWTELR